MMQMGLGRCTKSEEAADKVTGVQESSSGLNDQAVGTLGFGSW